MVLAKGGQKAKNALLRKLPSPRPYTGSLIPRFKTVSRDSAAVSLSILKTCGLRVPKYRKIFPSVSRPHSFSDQFRLEKSVERDGVAHHVNKTLAFPT
jgi:hypothetical protein